jgi:hypothetical protein
VEEGLDVYPALIRSDECRKDAFAAIAAAERAFPNWEGPPRQRFRLKGK